MPSLHRAASDNAVTARRTAFSTGFSRVLDAAVGAAVGLRLIARGLVAPVRQTAGIVERLGALAGHLPVSETVTIHWDEHQIPFIEARRDDDLAVALGAVHAHLRLGQMELLRRLAHGRTAEIVGPLAVGTDRALRLMDFGRAVPGIIAGLDPRTRQWAEAFLRGVNHQIASAPLPEEFRLLGVGCAPWTLDELFTAARLAAADVNWIVWSRLLRARRRVTPAQWATLWPELLRGGAPEAVLAGFAAPLGAAIRAGSNAAAVGAARSATGAALLAADPHLSVSLPNIWLAAGVHSPSYNVVGLMPTGFPIFAIGRNPFLAWGGTSLHAASSELFDARGQELTARQTTIHVRGGRSRRVTLRECALGPIVSDGSLLRDPAPLAMRWIGHAPSDEMGAMLGVMRARDPEEFRAALADFAVPAQNMLHAGRDGRVGHLLAARLPRRPQTPPSDLVSPAGAASAWDKTAGTEALPHWLDPAEQFVASANDRPPDTAIPVGFFFSPPDRVQRMRALLGADSAVTPDALAALQQDVFSAEGLRLSRALLARFTPAEASHPAARALAAWDGRYNAGSKGALVFEALIAQLARRVMRRDQRTLYAAVWTGRALLAATILSMPDKKLRSALARALPPAGRTLRNIASWGGAHQMTLRHFLAAMPVLGRRYEFGAFGADGGNDTLNKTGHRMSTGWHSVEYGASARFIADMARPDANRVVLLGGQDGWLGSTTFLDQVALWRQGCMIELPLQPRTARLWPHHTMHTPLA